MAYRTFQVHPDALTADTVRECAGIPYAFFLEMRFLFAALLVAHGIAHLVGFVASWRLATFAEMPYKTTVLAGQADIGDIGIRVMGGLWLLAALGFVAAAAAVITGTDWATRFTVTLAVASSVLCVIAWPEARIGLAVNLGLMTALLMMGRLVPIDLAR
jgi:hypothetical protein